MTRILNGIIWVVLTIILANTIHAGTAPNVPENINNISDLGGRTPADFVMFLALNKLPFYTFNNKLKGWVAKRDLAVLLSYVDSKQPCSNVRLSISNLASTEKSTIGQEAVFMIFGCWRGEYPPTLNSTAIGVDKAKIVKWAKEQ